ncbi:MAG: septation protein SepH [Nocardioides sp.]
MSAQELSRSSDQHTTAGQGDDLPSALTIASVSRDGRRLLLVDATGREFTVDVESRVSLEPPMSQPPNTDQPDPTQSSGSSRIASMQDAPLTLRPRDIQARIRAGESAEDLAASTRASLDKIMTYAAPVLAEREHIAERAQKASVRRADSSAANRQLGEAVAGKLATLDLDSDLVEWDSWRRADGRWALAAHFETSAMSGTGRFVFDTAGNFVVLDNDEARWLVGDLVVDHSVVHDDLQSIRARRLGEIGDDPLLLESALPGPVDPGGSTVHPRADRPAPARTEPEMTGPIEASPRRNIAKKRGRASVPSWDEIMFGSND